MKLVIAIIRPYHLEPLKAALNADALSLTSVSEILGGNAADGYTLIYRDRQIKVQKPKYRVEIIVDDFEAAGAVETIRDITSSGCPGNVSDATIMVLQLEDTDAPDRHRKQEQHAFAVGR